MVAVAVAFNINLAIAFKAYRLWAWMPIVNIGIRVHYKNSKIKIKKNQKKIIFFISTFRHDSLTGPTTMDVYKWCIITLTVRYE